MGNSSLGGRGREVLLVKGELWERSREKERTKEGRAKLSAAIYIEWFPIQMGRIYRNNEEEKTSSSQNRGKSEWICRLALSSQNEKVGTILSGYIIAA